MTTKPLMIATAIAASGLFVLTAQQAAPPAVYTAAQAAAGRAAYQSSCTQCHTDTLMGRVGKGGDVRFPPFMTKWGARTTKDLYIRIQEAVGSDRYMDEQLCLNLTAYILQANGARPGTQALTTATAVEIRSVATGL